MFKQEATISITFKMDMPLESDSDSERERVGNIILDNLKTELSQHLCEYFFRDIKLDVKEWGQ